MSTETQLKGDSLRRQLEASAKYAKENELELVESIDGKALRDIGVSGFKGKNSQRGVLAYFLEALKNGKVESNAVLLIESLDRLSRDRLTEALTQFISILDYGIEIVTLTDRQRYTKEIINQNQGAIFISLAIMFRANEESEIKSQRLQAVWNHKRSIAHEKPTTTIAPGWLTFSPKTKRFEVIPARVKIVRKIFELCSDTCGQHGITKYLNENAIPVFGKSKLWNRSYVHKILANRAVLGEFQA